MLSRLFKRKAADTPKPGPQLAMPAFTGDASPAPESVIRAWTQLFPDEPALTAEGGALSDAGISAVTFVAEGRTILFGHMPMPIPAGDIDPACEYSWMWPDAAAGMKGHRSHAVVASLPAGDAVAEAHAVSRLIAAVCRADDGDGAAGVYWGNGGQVHMPDIFVDMVQALSEDGGLPSPLWIGVGISGASETGPFSLSTRGLRAFGHQEFEILDSRRGVGGLRVRIYDIISYILRAGPVLKHGDTLGDTADERLRVEHATSRFRAGEPVIRLHMP